MICPQCEIGTCLEHRTRINTTPIPTYGLPDSSGWPVPIERKKLADLPVAEPGPAPGKASSTTKTDPAKVAAMNAALRDAQAKEEGQMIAMLMAKVSRIETHFEALFDVIRTLSEKQVEMSDKVDRLLSKLGV